VGTNLVIGLEGSSTWWLVGFLRRCCCVRRYLMALRPGVSYRFAFAGFICLSSAFHSATRHACMLDLPHNYVAGLLRHSLIHKNQKSYQKFTVVKASAHQF
jgi:hypothetical protein